MLQRPQECNGCPINEGTSFKGTKYQARGFSQPVGPRNADILIIGEAKDDFDGASGGKLDSLLGRAGISREDCRIASIIQCQPPNDWLVGAPYEREAINHCQIHRQSVLDEPHKVIITLGATATRTILGLPKERFNLENWHGTVTARPDGRGWVVPTFQPIHLLRGQHKLTGTVIYDLSVASEIAANGKASDPGTLVVDPPIDWFTKWVDNHLEQPNLWLAVDIETPGKINVDEGDLEIDDKKSNIIRVNFSNGPDLGITIPWEGRYIEQAVRLLSESLTLLEWNERYDNPILERDLANRGIQVPRLQPRTLDFQWGWHVLQSDLPKGLGFVAPFYSGWGAWKHISGPDPGRYAAIDALQTVRCSFGITKDLQQNGQWEVFLRHIHQMDTYVLRPAEEVGLLVDQQELQTFKGRLQVKEEALVESIRAAVPQEAGLTKITLLKRKPEGEEGLEEVTVDDFVQQCLTCKATDISKKHVCKDEKGKKDSSKTPRIELVETAVTRWKRTEVRDFLPSSDDDVRRYMELKGIKGRKGKKAKTSKPSVDEKALTAAYKKTKDPFFKLMLEFREVFKVRTTYADGMERRLGQSGRLHAHFGHHPSTLRLSCRNPNLQNVVGDKDGEDSPAAGFRGAIVSSVGNVLVEADFAGIEAVLTGWFASDPSYIRLARLGVHAYLASHLVGNPADLSWGDKKFLAHVGAIKKSRKQDYDRAKRVVHGTNYGLTPHGMVNNYPDLFTVHSATKIQQLYFDLCPKLVEWHRDIRAIAHRQGFIGGSDHPFGYRHWFFNIYTKQQSGKFTLGEDGKRCVAFLPQSTAAAILYDSCLELMNPDSPAYIGDFYEGQTPIRALVHDSILSEVPTKRLDNYLERVRRVMTRPIKQLPLPAAWEMGDYLSIGCEIKAGKSWLDMEVV